MKRGGLLLGPAAGHHTKKERLAHEDLVPFWQRAAQSRSELSTRPMSNPTLTAVVRPRAPVAPTAPSPPVPAAPPDALNPNNERSPAPTSPQPESARIMTQQPKAASPPPATVFQRQLPHRPGRMPTPPSLRPVRPLPPPPPSLLFQQPRQPPSVVSQQRQQEVWKPSPVAPPPPPPPAVPAVPQQPLRSMFQRQSAQQESPQPTQQPPSQPLVPPPTIPTAMATAPAAPKVALHALYGRWHTLLAQSSFVTWSDGGPPHLPRWTAAFVCPLSGELFLAGRCGDPRHYTVVVEPASSPGDAVVTVWYGKKILAEHAAAARCHDCFLWREAQLAPTQLAGGAAAAAAPASTTQVTQIGLDPPYGADRAMEVPSSAPEAVRQKILAKQQQVLASRASLAPNAEVGS